MGELLYLFEQVIGTSELTVLDTKAHPFESAHEEVALRSLRSNVSLFARCKELREMQEMLFFGF